MTTTPSGGQIVLAGDGKVIDVGGFEVVVLADAASTGGRFSLIETREPDAGAGPPLHIHHDCAESFVVLAGSYAMWVDDTEYTCPVGSFVFVPVGARHTFQSLEPGSRKLNLYTPAAMVGYFDELAAGIAAGMADDDLDALAGRHGMEVVGPIPKGYL